ncbi:hypothetical protein [Paenibacillus sp. AGC30]
MSDYNYVQYYEETGNVVTISTTEPRASDGYAVAKTEKGSRATSSHTP